LLAQPPDAPRRFERFWSQAFEKLRSHPRLRDVRIRGSIAAIEVDAEGGYLAEAGRDMRRKCLERGVFLRPLGPVLYAMPPYCTSLDSLEKIADAMIAAIQ
jgi:adenosylmethionine-8-amino-7-oxononanoate aminotransferase